MKTIAEYNHKSAAKMLRYCGYKAICKLNSKETQPWEIHIKGIDKEEQNKITSMIWDMYKDYTINIIIA